MFTATIITCLLTLVLLSGSLYYFDNIIVVSKLEFNEKH